MFGVGVEIPVAGSLETAASSTVLFEFVPEGAGEPLDFAFDAEGGRFEGKLNFDIADSGLYRLEVYVDPAGEELTYVGASEVEVGEFVVTAVVEDEILPHALALAQNFPNPFNGETTIRLALPAGPPPRGPS